MTMKSVSHFLILLLPIIYDVGNMPIFIRRNRKETLNMIIDLLNFLPVKGIIV